MSRPLTRRTVIDIALRLGLAGIFIYAGIAKMANVETFASSIARFELLPEALVNLAALSLPPLEILSGVALLTGPFTRFAAFNLSCLCVLFLGVLLSAAFRRIEVDCSCFGSGSQLPLSQLVIRDLMLLAASSFLYLGAVRRVGAHQSTGRKGADTHKPSGDSIDSEVLSQPDPFGS